MPELMLRDDCIDLWYTFVDQADSESLLVRYRELLPQQEQAGEKRFVFQRDRDAHLITRALQRTVLSRYCDVAPSDWEFQTNPQGKPSIARPEGTSLYFNLSHTRGLIVCAVASSEALGVDVENVRRDSGDVDLAHRYFAPSEVAALTAHPSERQRDVFFDFWTLKESYIKARGMGLSLPLDGFAFTLSPQQPPRIAFTSAIPDDPARWWFAQIRLGEQYQIALASGAPGLEDRQVRLMETVPLSPDREVRVLKASVANHWVL